VPARTTSAEQPIVDGEAFQPPPSFPEPVGSVTVGLPGNASSLARWSVSLSHVRRSDDRAPVVVGESGKQYTVRFAIGTPADDVLYVTIPVARPSGTTPQPFSVASMLRTLRAGSDVPGQQAVELPAPTCPDPRVSVTQAAARSVGGLLGMVVTVRNTQPQRLSARGHRTAELPSSCSTLAFVSSR
jgi:hypothetical protein